MKNRVVLCLTVFILLMFQVVPAGAEITSLASLNNKSVTVGVSQGSSAGSSCTKGTAGSRTGVF